jgi:PIN domain nuclease of toxin-antitoxin system
MNGLLLDTHIFIWVVENNPKFPQVVRDRIEETVSKDSEFDAYPIEKVWA